VVLAVGLRCPHPGRREELHCLGVDRPDARRRLVAQVVTEHANHRLCSLEGLRRVDVYPSGITHVAAVEQPLRRQGPHAVREADVACPTVDALELRDQLGADAEDAGIDTVVVADVLANIGDAAMRQPDLRRVVEIEAALDVVVDAERAGALR
jgi:hypothetical protein